MSKHNTLTATLARFAARGFFPWNTFHGRTDTVEAFLARPEIDGDTQVMVAANGAVRADGFDVPFVHLVKNGAEK